MVITLAKIFDMQLFELMPKSQEQPSLGKGDGGVGDEDDYDFGQIGLLVALTASSACFDSDLSALLSSAVSILPCLDDCSSCDTGCCYCVAIRAHDRTWFCYCRLDL